MTMSKITNGEDPATGVATQTREYLTAAGTFDADVANAQNFADLEEANAALGVAEYYLAE